MKKIIFVALILTIALPGASQELEKSELLVYKCEINDGEKLIQADLSVHWSESAKKNDSLDITVTESLSGLGVISFTDNEHAKVERVSLSLPYLAKNGYITGESFSANLKEPFSKRGFGGFLYGNLLKTDVGSISCSQNK